MHLFVGLFVARLTLLCYCVHGVQGVRNIKAGILLVEGRPTEDNDDRLLWRYALMRPALDVAAAAVEKEYGIHFEMFIATYPATCDAVKAMGGAMDLYFNKTVEVFIGPGCSEVIDVVGAFFTHFHIPMVTGAGEFVVDKFQHPTMTRFSPNIDKQVDFVLAVMGQYGWQHICIVYDSLDKRSRGEGTTLYNGLRNTEGLPLPALLTIDNDQTEYAKVLDTASKVSRVVFIIAPHRMMRLFMLEAHRKKMTTGDYVFLSMFMFHDEVVGMNTGLWQIHPDDGDNAAAKEAFHSLLIVASLEPNENNEQKSEVISQINDAAKNYNTSYSITDEFYNYFALSFYDAVTYLARTINMTLQDNETLTQKNGRDVARHLWNSSFRNDLGEVVIDANGNRLSGFLLLDMQPSGVFRPVWKQEAKLNKTNQHLDRIRYILWPNNNLSSSPPDVPECGFTGQEEKCQNTIKRDVIIWNVTGIVIVLVTAIIIGAVVYRKVSYEWKMARAIWEVNWDDLVFKRRARYSSVKVVLHDTNIPSTVLTENIHPMVPRIAFFHGSRVVVRKFRRTSSVSELSMARQMEVKKMMVTQHANLVRFVGACIHDNHFCILIEYCPKGSLEDILQHETIQLDWMFKFSLITDIIKGMEYLHASPIGVHGRLRSANCVVDSKFELKLTDYGLASFYAEDDERRFSDGSNLYQFNRNRLWIAPELLRSSRDRKMTPQGDVYSFAIILQEIIMRTGPYESYEMEPEDIVNRVMNHEDPPFRPKVGGDEAKYELIYVMKKCWEETAADRPTFRTIHFMMRQITKGHRLHGSMVDSQLMRLAKYAESLERLLQERSNLYASEKAVTDELLHRVMPGSVVEKVRHGRPVMPVKYDSATIMCATLQECHHMIYRSTPQEVIDFMNDYYAMIDEVVRNKVFKLDTSEGLTLVAGVPEEKHEQDHAVDIAVVAISILDATQRFLIRHMPLVKVHIRIGIHTGPCAAGVIGQRIPRYCLFGPALHVAKHIENLGEDLKIHVSQHTADLLKKTDMFTLKPREGVIQIQGVGAMSTEWLVSAEVSMIEVESSEMEIMQTDLTVTIENTPIASEVSDNGDEIMKAVRAREQNLHMEDKMSRLREKHKNIESKLKQVAALDRKREEEEASALTLAKTSVVPLVTEKEGKRVGFIEEQKREREGKRVGFIEEQNIEGEQIGQMEDPKKLENNETKKPAIVVQRDGEIITLIDEQTKLFDEATIAQNEDKEFENLTPFEEKARKSWDDHQRLKTEEINLISSAEAKMINEELHKMTEQEQEVEEYDEELEEKEALVQFSLPSMSQSEHARKAKETTISKHSKKYRE